MLSLATLKTSQLRNLAPHIRIISTTPWSLGSKPSSGPDIPSSTPPPPLPLPTAPTRGGRLTDLVATAIHRLVLLVTNLRRASANEVYVRRVLQEQVGVDPFDLDLLSLRRPEVFRLSVRHNIEPVTSLLRSRGLTGSALARVIAQAPGVLFISVEDDLLPLCEFLREELGNRGMGALVRHPQLAEAPAVALRYGAAALRAAGAAQEDTALMLWGYPDLFMQVANVVAAVAGERGGSEAAVPAGGMLLEEVLPDAAERSRALEGVAAALSHVRTATKEAATSTGSGLEATQRLKASEAELRRAVEALESTI